jgi:Protein of unknown function (DUF3455)
MSWKMMAVIVLLGTAVPKVSAGDITPPTVPENLEVPAGHRVFLVARAEGTQNYICLPSATGIAWTLFGPQATLFNNAGRQIITHFLSPNPDENGTLRATWQHSNDTSAVWAMATATSVDPAFVAPGAIPWLRLEVVGTADATSGAGRLTRTTFIQRVNTAGGVAPAAGCSVPTDIGMRAFVPYTTDYVFYR